jgi:hypothetical protein
VDPVADSLLTHLLCLLPLLRLASPWSSPPSFCLCTTASRWSTASLQPRRMALKAMSWLRAAAATDPWLPNAADFACLFVRWQHRPPCRRQVRQDRPWPTVRLRGHVLVWTMAGEAQTRAELECPLDTCLSTETSTAIACCPALMLEVVEMAPVLVVTASAACSGTGMRSTRDGWRGSGRIGQERGTRQGGARAL